MRTFSIQVLGCRVNHYEAEQMAALLRARGLLPVDDPGSADLRIVHTCSVTSEAAAKSGQMARRMTRLPVLQPTAAPPELPPASGRTVITGCWATSDPASAGAIPGVDAVLGHGDDVAGRLSGLLNSWLGQTSDHTHQVATSFASGGAEPEMRPGMTSLPLLGARQDGRQRAFIKIQDGCDAWCTYCIIPQLRPALWSKPIDDCVEEARRLVDAGHREIVLTGIFLGAYGQTTALRRRQGGAGDSLARLIAVLSTSVPGLLRLRLSSLEPGDMTADLLAALRDSAAVVPHFHLPLQSGSDRLLRRMNRQYRRDDFLRMIDRVKETFDRPAITTDIIVGFPGETDAEFAHTLDVVQRTGFLHIHAFPYSPRPNTAAARWTDAFVPAARERRRVTLLNDQSRACGMRFRRAFVGEPVAVLVERPRQAGIRHGRCERYFEVKFPSHAARAGDLVSLRVDRVEGDETWGTPL